MGAFTPAGIEYLVKNFSGGMSKLGKLDKAQEGLGNSASNAGKKFTGLGKGVLSVGAAAGGAALVGVTALGAGIAALGVSSVKTAISFESAFAGVLKTTDGLTDSVGNLNVAGMELREGFVDLSKEVPIVFEELAAIGELGGQLGIGKDALIEFTESVAALGVSTNLSTEEAASGLARMSNIFNVSSEDMGGNITRLGSSIVELGNNFATTERDILAFAERVSGAGAIAGLTQADVLGIGAAMSSVGVQAEAGGTAVQKVLLAINNAVVGTTTGFVDNTDAIDENINRLTSMTGKLVALESKAGLTAEQILQMRDEFIAAGGSAEEFGRQLGATERRQLFETALAVRDLKDETQLLRDLQGTPIDAGQLEKFASVAGLAATEFEELWKEDAAGAFQLFVEGLGKQGDEAINTLDELGLTDQRLIRAFLSLSGAGDLLGDTLDTANSAFGENTALADEAAKRYATTESQMLIFKNTLRALGDEIGSRFLPFLNDLIFVGKDLVNKFADPVARAIDEKVIPAIEGLIALGGQLATAFQEGGVSGLFTELGAQIQTAFVEIQPILAQLGQQFFAWITETAIPFAQEQLPILFNSIIAFINENWPRVVERMNELSNSFFDWVNESVIPAIPGILTSVISGMTTFLTENWPQIQETLNGWADLFWVWVEDVVSRSGETLAGIIASIGQWALSGETQTQLANFGVSIGESLVNGILELSSDQTRMTEILTKIATGLATAAVAIAGLLIIVGGQIVAGILEGILNKITGGEFEAATFNELGSILSGIADNLGTILKEDFTQVGLNIVNGLTFGLVKGIPQLEEAFIALMDGGIEGLKSHLGIASPSTVFAEFGKDIVLGLIQGIQSLAGTVGETLASIFGDLLGGGEETLSFANISPEGIESVNKATQELSDLLSQVNNQIIVILPESLLLFSEMFLITFEQIILSVVRTIETITQMDLLIIKISTVTLPQLATASTITTNIMIAGFNAINAVLRITNQLLTEMAEKLVIIAEKAADAAETLRDEFTEAANRIKSQLIPALNQVIKTLERVETQAEATARAVNSITGSAEAAATGGESGIGFQAGTPNNTGGLLGLGFRIPSGFPNDTFPMRGTSGEEVLVTPRGTSIESLILSRLSSLGGGDTITETNYNFDMTVNTGASATGVIQQFEVMRGLLGA